MKKAIGASSIVSLLCFFLLTGCENFHVPNVFGEDEVPDEIKDQPRFIEIPASEEEKGWPRLGDVPFKPKDFSPKTTYEDSMSELERNRLEAVEARKRALQNDSSSPNAAVQNKQTLPVLQPPQFITK
jgi:hypothetical protein